jgi:hypothetical protein
MFSVSCKWTPSFSRRVNTRHTPIIRSPFNYNIVQSAAQVSSIILFIGWRRLGFTGGPNASMWSQPNVSVCTGPQASMCGCKVPFLCLSCAVCVSVSVCVCACVHAHAEVCVRVGPALPDHAKVIIRHICMQLRLGCMCRHNMLCQLPLKCRGREASCPWLGPVSKLYRSTASAPFHVLLHFTCLCSQKRLGFVACPYSTMINAGIWGLPDIFVSSVRETRNAASTGFRTYSLIQRVRSLAAAYRSL